MTNAADVDRENLQKLGDLTDIITPAERMRKLGR